MQKTVAIIGFGEAGGIFAEDLRKQGCVVKVYDILVDDDERRKSVEEKAIAFDVQLQQSTAEAIEDTELIFSLVTADSATDVAREAAKSIRPSQLFFDLNSVSPDNKRHNAAIIEKTGAAYFDIAVMAPVPPTRLQVPLLISGPDSKKVTAVLNGIGMNAQAISEDIGVACAVKMCRSVVVKGLEAITLECFYAAKHFGAEQHVLESLKHTFPGLNWGDKEPNYFISRIAQHGRRRAAEMRESANTIKEAGIEPRMAAAIAQTEDWLIDRMEEKRIDYDEDFDWEKLLTSLQSTVNGRQ